MNIAARRRTAAAGPIGWLTAVTMLAGLLAGCSGQAVPLPPDPPTVHVEIVDDGVVYQKPVPAGRVVFRITNAGEVAHRLSLLPLSEDFPPIDEQLQGDTRRQAQLLARVADLQPGASDAFAVDLADGQRYAMVDFSESHDGSMHGRLGVADEFVAGGER